MTPHEEEMLEEIQTLHARLATSERGRLLWKLLAIGCLLVIGFLGWKLLRG